MNREQLIESMVAQVMEEFDFDYVHNVMVNLDLKWYIRGEEVVPSTYQIIKKAEKLLIDVKNHYGEKDFYSCGTGGLMASLNEGTLSLQFILTEAFSYVEGFTKTED